MKGFVLCGLLLLAACAPAYRGEPIVGPLETSDPQVIAGERVFAANCNGCHPGGTRGVGLALNNKPLTPDLISFQVRNGLGTMPSFSPEQISEEELDALTTYLLALRENRREADRP